MALSPLSNSYGISRQILELRAQMDDLQRQLATGKKADTYGELGTDRVLSLSLRARVSSIEGYQQTISQAGLHLNLIQQNLGRFEEIVGETRTDSLQRDLQLSVGGQTQTQISAGLRLNEAVGLLNFDLAGRHFFGGRDTQDAPVLASDMILEGDGNKAGLKQLIAERRLADLGADGRGRLVVASGPADTVNLTEDAASSPFGLKLSGISGNLSGTTLTPPAGSPAALSVTFSATLPQPGETVRLTFALPDGSQEVLQLTATATVPAGPGEFLIGTDASTTATSFEAALGTELETVGATSLRAASAYAAADNFFIFDATTPPQRVSGPPFETATALVDATATDTALWYSGDLSTGLARDAAIARVDDNLTVAYGVRADEAPLRTSITALAVLAAETFDDIDPRDSVRYDALVSRTTERLNFASSQKSVLDLIGELGFKQNALEKAGERHADASIFTQGLLDDAENADSFEVGTLLLNLQNRLQASFQTTATLSRLSLVNFL